MQWNYPQHEVVIDLPNGDQEYIVCDVLIEGEEFDESTLTVALSNPVLGEVLNPHFIETQQQDRETNWPWIPATDSQLVELFSRAQAVPVRSIVEQCGL